MALPTTEISNAVIDAVRSRGERTVRRQLGIAPATLARIVGGLPVQRGTLALVSQRLDELAREEGIA